MRRSDGVHRDGYTTSPSDRPVFSTDTLDLGTVFTAEPTPTKRLIVHNPHSKQLRLSDVRVSGPAADCFRLNVDGISGKTFSGIDIRGKGLNICPRRGHVPRRAAEPQPL